MEQDSRITLGYFLASNFAQKSFLKEKLPFYMRSKSQLLLFSTFSPIIKKVMLFWKKTQPFKL